MKTTKKAILFLLISTILLSITLPTYADEVKADTVTTAVQTTAEQTTAEQTTAEQKQSLVISFSLDTAIKYALENSASQKINGINLEASNLSLVEQNEAQYRALGKGGWSFEGVKTRNGYYVRLSQMSKLITEKTIEQTSAQIRSLTENVYFSYQNALDKYEICDNILSFAEDNLKNANLKNSLGLSSDIDLLYAQNAVLKAKIDKENLGRSLDYARLDFNKGVGLPLDTKFQLLDKISSVKYEDVNVAEKAKLARTNRMEAISAKEQSEVDKKLFEATDKFYMPNTYAYKKAEFTAKKSADVYKSTLDTVELSVYKVYNDMVNAYASLEMLDSLITLQQKVYDIAKIKYSQGIVANSEVTDSLNKLLDAKLNKAQAMLSYNLAKSKFINSYGIGLGN